MCVRGGGEGLRHVLSDYVPLGPSFNRNRTIFLQLNCLGYRYFTNTAWPWPKLSKGATNYCSYM